MNPYIVLAHQTRRSIPISASFPTLEEADAHAIELSSAGWRCASVWRDGSIVDGRDHLSIRVRASSSRSLAGWPV
jgi:hypothetical protein